jgi:mRNA (2'-O-methyladenosine-N6-)-methyltransferase
MWVTGRATELGLECFEQWGYTLIEELIWVKIN